MITTMISEFEGVSASYVQLKSIFLSEFGQQQQFGRLWITYYLLFNKELSGILLSPTVKLVIWSWSRMSVFHLVDGCRQELLLSIQTQMTAKCVS